VSVVLPAYREAILVLTRSVRSVLNQSHRDLELVIVVDDPANQTKIDACRAFMAQDRRVSLVVNPGNLGVWASYNVGIRHARGEFVAIQDSDDVSLPHRLERSLAYLRANPEVDVVGASLAYTDQATDKVIMTREYPATIDGAIKRYCPLGHGTTLRKRSLHDAHGLYDESPDVRHAADYELWLRWYVAGVRFRNIPDVLYTYYQHPESFKSNHVRAILRDTVRLKGRYAGLLRFSIADRGYLAAEWLVSKLPSTVIMSLFFIYNRLRAPRRADSAPTTIG
jgi:glycosyltransferase involved in cell wall biosynthesis